MSLVTQHPVKARNGCSDSQSWATGEIRSQITAKEKKILTQYFLHAMEKWTTTTLPDSISVKGFEIISQHRHYRRRHLRIFYYCASSYGYVKLKQGGLSTFFLFLLNFSLEGQKCCHIAYSNQFKQYQIFPKEQKRIHQHVKNSLLLPLAQLSQASPNLQLSPVGEDVNEVSLKTAVLRRAT